jgi:uncharacterized protein (UPF0303 family)
MTCRPAHLVVDYVGLMLDDLDAGAGRRVHHVFGDGELAVVVDADLSDDQRHVDGTDPALSDLDFWLRHAVNCTRRVDSSESRRNCYHARRMMERVAR